MIAAILTISLIIPVNVMAATDSEVIAKTGSIKINDTAKSKTVAKSVSNGWSNVSGKWFYYKAGKLLTGWQKIGRETYYLKKTGGKGVKGKMLTGWQTISKKTFYFGSASSGALRTGWQKINNKWFYFRKDGTNGAKGVMLTGWQKINDKNYYLKKAGKLGTKGKMLSGWQKINNKNFYFGSSSDGSLKTGWQTIAGKNYYFKIDGGWGTVGENLRNGTYTIDGKKYSFDASGVCASKTPAANTPSPDYVLRVDPTDGKTWKVEPEFDTDPQVGSKNITEEAFMAALIFTEGGDQGEVGQLMVAMCVLNRVVDKKLGYYPNSLKFVVYENGQYAVARKVSNGGTGTLTKELKIIQEKGYTWWKKSYTTKEQCAKSAQKAFKIIDDWKKDPKKNPRTINKDVTKLIKAANKQYGVKNTTESTSFDHTFFMTPGAFNRMGLSSSRAERFDYKGHVFFRYWKK